MNAKFLRHAVAVFLLVPCSHAVAEPPVDDADAIRAQAEAIASEQAMQESRGGEESVADGRRSPGVEEKRVPGAWERRNRFMAVMVDNLRRHYTEFDRQGRTFDGIIDEENGNLHGVAVAVRWEEVPGGRSGQLPFLVDGDIRVHAGNTSYRGYLQNLFTGALTPYNGNTANVLADLRARAMLAVAGGERMRLLPWIEGRMNWWYRDLGQYDEMYEHQAVLAGAMLQWAANEDLVVELDGGVGLILFSHIDVPSIGLSETLGNEPVNTLSLTLRWQLGEHGGLLAGVRQDYCAYAGSAVSNGFFEPPSDTGQTSVVVGMTHAF